MAEFHPLANVFPLMEGVDFDELVESIKASGQLEPIIMFEGKILDGRNRARACKSAGVTPVASVEDFRGTYEEARDFVVDANLRRRHLDPSQRALIAAKLSTLGHGGDRRSDQAANLPVETQAGAAERLNVSERSVRDARRVVDHGAPELVRAVDRGEVSVSAAAKSLRQEERAARPEARPAHDLASPPSLPQGVAAANPLRNLINISGGELARWVKATTPHDRMHAVRVLRMAAAILEDELNNSEAA